VCRAVRVLCVAEDAERLRELKQAVVAAEWELTAGATEMRAALDQIDVERPHAVVAFGPFEDLVALVAERFPGMRIVTDRPADGAVVVGAMSEARAALRALPRPGPPITWGQ
jgi:hypothetical protein